MKKLIFSLLAIMIATTAFAQSTLVATLSHEGEISSYYGANALKEAVTAAANGDVITLSSGQFNAVNIDKAITVRGAGMTVNEANGTYPTEITGDFTISAPKEETEATLTLEGLYHNFNISCTNALQNVQIIKCRLKRINGSSGMSVTFLHCRINEQLYFVSFANIVCINCYLNTPHISNGSALMQNCVIWYDNSSRFVKKSTFYNCLFFLKNKSYCFDSSNVAYNCLITGDTAFDTFFKDIPNSSNKCVGGYDIFKTFRGTFDDTADFELTDEAAAQYLGTDGTQVGIYGGMLPYETTPSNPQITKFNVASKSSADGKLSVDIQVGVPE